MRRLLLCAALLASAAVHADPSGKKWFTTGPVPYLVFAHSSINGVSNFSTNVLPSVQGGFSRWAQPSCTRWQISYAGSFSSPTGTSAIASDSKNRVIWLGGSQWRYGSQTLGLTTTIYYTNTGEIIDADMEMNNNVVWKVSGTATNQVDVESIVTHEAGHFLGLDHSAPTSAVMYAYYNSSAGEIKRNLTTTDINDVCTVYPNTAGGGGQGDPCTLDSQCSTAAPACRGAVGTTGKICTITCTSSTQCPTGYTCQNASPSGMACLPPVGAVDLCKFCSSGSQCSTGLCMTNGTQNWCSRTCMSESDCGAGYDCVQGTSSKICSPKNGTCPTPQCASSTDCPVGYACQGGMCTATGNVGDRCEVSVYCKPCGACILESNGTEAICRACCGGGSGSGSCQGCSSTSCTSGFQCYNVTSSTDQICYPSAGAQVCQACDAQTPCVTGYTCYAGRCHAPCNPTNPGACNACYDTGSGGICGCPGEVVSTGQECGQLASGLKICTTGNACVGTPKTCRAKCDLNNAGSCPSGQACQSVDGQAVCIATNSPGQRCSACQTNGACAQGYVCVNGRCYEPCDPTFPACNSCVDAAAGVGICACDDQLSGPGQGCGLIAGEVYACAQGSTCVDGTCRMQCSDDSHCGVGDVCNKDTGICIEWQVPTQPNDGGTSSTTPPFVAPQPDAGRGTTPNFGGCGCTAGAGASGAWLLLGALGMLLRRRRQRQPR
jgi:MYXO-CTERM domain-containing protein